MGGHARYHVTHVTRYAYPSNVASAHQLAHLKPRSTHWQRVKSHTIEIEPNPTERAEGVDYFGNGIVRFMIDTPHKILDVVAESVVELDSNAPDAAAASPAWEQALALPGAWGPNVDLDVEQYRAASPMVPILEESIAYARASFPSGRPWLAAMLDLTHRIHAEFRYDPKATTLTTQVREVLEHRRGVCQDFAHLMLSCLRSLGLPARYVSGYVLNRVAPGEKAPVRRRRVARLGGGPLSGPGLGRFRSDQRKDRRLGVCHGGLGKGVFRRHAVARRGARSGDAETYGGGHGAAAGRGRIAAIRRCGPGTG